MASSSSFAAASQPLKQYDVFISFRGEDTRSNFTSHLHDALLRNQIDTYIDYRIEKGEEVWPALEKAIEESTLFLVIFSPDYASSTWCLRELSKILECTKEQGYLVMPVFYKIEPSNVRKQSGTYQKAFENYEQNNKINKQQLDKWREALTHTSNLSGWDSNKSRNEVEVIRQIVKCVKRKMDFMYQNGGDFKNLVGIQEKIAHVESLLNKGSPQDVRFIGIWGIGGVGKTTLAKAVFLKLFLAYEGFCFLANVREESKERGITSLKKKLILTLLGDEESHTGMPDGITPYQMRRLGRKRSFIVLDDVDNSKHIEELAAVHDWFGPGSKILITTRNMQVIEKEVDDIYEFGALNFSDALHLFSLNAFKDGCADTELRELLENVVHYTKCIPLALKVLGCFLYGKSKKEWKSQLNKLKKMPFPEIHEILKWSFEGLDYEEKNIFLDIACFFKGKHVKYIQTLLGACGYSIIIGLKNLKDKTLITISEGGIVSMHDLIQEMGRMIIREESLNNFGLRSRVFDSKEIFQILNNNKGTKVIQGITLNISEIEEMLLSPQVFRSMPNLKFIDFHYENNGDEKMNKLRCPSGLQFLSNELRLLHWERCPMKSFPAKFTAENLVTFEMPNSNLIKLWDGVQNFVNLWKVNLARSKNLIELPNFSKAINLTKVDLSDCSKLRSVHPSILSLHGPSSTLNIETNKAFTSPKSYRLQSKTKDDYAWEFTLDLSRTAIDELPSSRGHLSKIDELNLVDCESMTSLPYKLVDLSKLRNLTIRGCNKLVLNLYLIFGGLGALECLSLEDCSGLFKLPNNINLLSSLWVLSLPRTDVETLPTSIKYLSNLQLINLDECRRLQYLPELPPSIRRLFAHNCTSLESIHITSSTAVKSVKEEKELDIWWFHFENCVKLDELSIKAIEAKFLLELNIGVHKMGNLLVYPGNRVPDWFMYRSTRSSITVNLYSIPRPWDQSFVLCVVTPKGQWIDIKYKWSINGQDVEQDYTEQRIHAFDDYTFTDHVILRHVANLPPQVQRIIEKIETKDQSSTYHPSVEIKFEDTGFGIPFYAVAKIKECGICPTSAPEIQSYIKQMERALQPLSNSIGMEVSCSSNNTHHKKVVPAKPKHLISQKTGRIEHGASMILSSIIEGREWI